MDSLMIKVDILRELLIFLVQQKTSKHSITERDKILSADAFIFAPQMQRSPDKGRRKRKGEQLLSKQKKAPEASSSLDRRARHSVVNGARSILT